MPYAVSSASTLERPVVLRQVEISPTDPEHYITDLYALNVQALEGTSGDWHDVFHYQEGYDNSPQVTLAVAQRLIPLSSTVAGACMRVETVCWR